MKENWCKTTRKVVECIMYHLSDALEDFIVGQPSLFWFTNDKCSIHWTIVCLYWLNSCSSFSFEISGKIKGQVYMSKYKKIN